MEQSKNRTYLVFLVSALWLLSITAPPVLQLLDENSPGIAYTLNEEESKEQEKKDKTEEIIFSNSQGYGGVLPSFYSELSAWRNTLALGTVYMEIKLPPPEILS